MVHKCPGGLQGHNRPVTGLAWALHDTRLISIGGSACYFWRVPAGQRISDLDHVDLGQVAIGPERV